MSSKKKNAKPSWVKLNEHEYVLNRSVQDVNLSLLVKDVDIPSSLIFHGLFKAEVGLRKSKEPTLSDSTKSNLVHIHPTTMQLCGIAINSPVLLCNSCCFVYQAWPSADVPLGKVAMSESQLACNDLSIGSFVFLSAQLCKVVCATSIELLPVAKQSHERTKETFFSSPHFGEYISHCLDGVYTTRHQSLHLNYFGTSFSFEVNKVNGKSMDSDGYDEANVFMEKFNLSEQFNSLNLSENVGSNSSSLNEVLTSTPLKEKHEVDVVHRNKKLKIKEVFCIRSATSISIKCGSCEDETAEMNNSVKVTFSDIGGLKQQIDTLRNIVISPIHNSREMKLLGLQPVHGIILHGPSGTGKTMLAKALANEVGGQIKTISNTEIISRYFGESETKLRSIFDEALAQLPCVVIIEEADVMFPKRDSARSDAEKRLVAAFATILDDLNKSFARVVVIATTNRIDSIDSSLRRAGRFDREIEITSPSPEERVEIFQKLLSKFLNDVTMCQLEDLSDGCHGYVGADLMLVCKEAALHAVLRSKLRGSDTAESVGISLEDLKHGIKCVPPSAMRELILQVPKVYWQDIGGNENVKKCMKQTIEWPLKHPESFKRLGINPLRGLLLYGPPGCSKTLTAKALATESGLNFISIKGPELFSKYVGDSELGIRRIFAKARSSAPSIVFIDELDAIAKQRGSENSVADRVLVTLLTEMDGVEARNDVIVIAATNRPHMIDQAFLRPGRIDRSLYVPLPDPQSRREIFRVRFRTMPISSDVDVNQLVRRTEMYSGAEICAVCEEAGMAALAESLDAEVVESRHFDVAISNTPPQTSTAMVRSYEAYRKCHSFGLSIGNDVKNDT